MRQFVESLKRLLISKAINDTKINELHSAGKISAEEKEYIFAK